MLKRQRLSVKYLINRVLCNSTQQDAQSSQCIWIQKIHKLHTPDESVVSTRKN